MEDGQHHGDATHSFTPVLELTDRFPCQNHLEISGWFWNRKIQYLDVRMELEMDSDWRMAHACPHTGKPHLAAKLWPRTQLFHAKLD